MAAQTKTSIYKVVCKDLSIKDTFIGSSRNLSTTAREYKIIINNGAKQKPDDQYMFATVKANGGFAKWDLILIEEFTYKNRHELAARIRYHVEKIGASLNQPLPADMQPASTTPTCPCGSFVPNPNNIFHIESALHQNYLLSLIKPEEPEFQTGAAARVVEEAQAEPPAQSLLTSSAEPQEPQEPQEPKGIACICGAVLKNPNNAMHLKSGRHLSFVLAQLQSSSQPNGSSNTTP